MNKKQPKFIMRDKCIECNYFNRQLRICIKNEIWIDMDNLCILFKQNEVTEVRK